MQKIILTGGGTAGHITPNIALLPYLRQFDIHYIGAADSLEQKLIQAFPYVTFHAVTCVKLVRSFSGKNFTIPFKLIKGISECKKLLKELQPAVIFSKGGYVGLPVSLAAKKNYPLVLHESDFSLGLANKLAAKKCKFLCTSFSTLAKSYPNGIFTGSPIRNELYFGSADIAKKQSGLTTNSKPNLLIMGGSLGATAINNAVSGSINELCAYFNIIHICGTNNEQSAKHADYFSMGYCSNIADYFSWADFCLSRGGANSLAELIALKIPSLIIPLPKGNSRGDQEDNANYYKSLGVISVLNQSDLTAGTLMSALLTLKSAAPTLKANMVLAPSPDGTRKIAAILTNFLHNSLLKPHIN